MDRKIMGLFMVFSIGVLMISGCVSKEAKIEELRVTEPEETGGKVLKLGVQPCWSPSNSFTMFSPLVDYLSEETGLDIKLVVVETEKEFDETVKEVDFTLQDAFSVYIHDKKIAALYPLVIAVSEKGESEERGAIIVRADSDIKSISDLRGKTFLFGSAHNAPKFLAAFVTLKKSGVDPDNDLKSYDLGGDCSDNAMSVFLGEYDAGAVCRDFVDGKEGKKKFNFETDLRVVADTVPVPNWMLTASENVDKDTVEKVKKALLKISPESSLAQEVLEETEWGGFVRYSDELNKTDELVEKYTVPIK